MAGLLDDFSGFMNTPGGMGLLSAVASGLAGARRGQPMNSIGAGLLGGLQGYSQAQDQAMQQKRFNTMQQMSDLQLKQAQQSQADQDAIRNLAKSSYTAPSMTIGDVMSAPGAAGPTMDRAQLLPKTQGTFDTSGFINGVMGVNPLEGIKMRASLAKESQFDKFKPENYTPQSVAQAMQSGDYSKLVRQDKLHFADNGGGIVGLNPYTGQQISATDKTGDPFSDLVVRGPNGQLVPNQALVGAKTSIAHAGAARTNVTVDAAPKAFWSDFGKQTSEQLFNERGVAQSAANTIGSIAELRKAVSSGAFQGAGADMKLGAAKALGALGLKIAPNEVANSEQFNAIANSFVLDKIKTLGANPSNADREFIEKTVPRLSTDPAALPQLLNYMESRARGQVKGFNTKMKGVQQQAPQGFSPYSLEVPEPPMYGQDQAGSAPGQMQPNDIAAAAAAELARRRGK